MIKRKLKEQIDRILYKKKVLNNIFFVFPIMLSHQP